MTQMHKNVCYFSTDNLRLTEENYYTTLDILNDDISLLKRK